MEEKATVLVTGSSGFIGAAVMRRLARSYRVVGLDSRPPAQPPPEGQGFVAVDLTSSESVSQALAAVSRGCGGRLAAVVHLAAYYDFSGRPSPRYREVTVEGTERLARGLLGAGFDVGQFLFTSTLLVHKPCRPGERITEDWPLEPRWPYPQSKVETEELLTVLHGTMPLVVMRAAGVYDDDCRSIPIAHQIHHIYERWLLSHLFPGDASHGQPFVHLDDLAEAISQSVERRARLPPELVLLIAEEETLGYRELQHRIGLMLYGKPWKTMRVPKAAAKAGAWARSRLPFRPEPLISPRVIPLADDHYAVDAGRARRVLGWAPRRSLSETLPKMIAFLERDPAGFYRVNKIVPPPWLRVPVALREGQGG